MKIEEIFAKSTNDDKSLTITQFNEIVKAQSTKPKFADLAEGRYVDKQKYEDDLAKKDKEIESLKTNIQSRDKDIEDFQTQIADAQAKLEESGGNAEKLAEMSAKLEEMKQNYEQENGKLQQQLNDQAYDFAVRDYANGQKFSSVAAKRDFIQSMISKKLPMEGDKILGADDFVKVYKKDNADAFYKDNGNGAGGVGGAGGDAGGNGKPHFTGQTPGSAGTGSKMSLTELMQLKNENPQAVISFE